MLASETELWKLDLYECWFPSTGRGRRGTLKSDRCCWMLDSRNWMLDGWPAGWTKLAGAGWLALDRCWAGAGPPLAG